MAIKIAVLLTHRKYRVLAAMALLALAAVAEAVWRAQAVPPAEAQRLPAASIAGAPADALQLRRTAQGDIPMPQAAAAAHASSLLVMPQQAAAELMVFWFSGERESGPRVQIAASQWERATQRWSPPRIVANRHVLGEQLGFGVRRLGNPVSWRDRQGRIHLFVVATGWGGWAASRILHLRQKGTATDLSALEFEPVRVLPLSWLWNISHLVRNAPLALSDGAMVLPAHFELGWKYPVALRIGPEGGFEGMQRISQRNYVLQPTLLAQSPTHWWALMRDARPQGHIGAALSTDAGQSWHDVPDLALTNPDASVAGLGWGQGSMVLAHNASLGTRSKLDLSASSDGRHWTLVQTLAEGAPDSEFSYPAMAWSGGHLWVAYTVDRQFLAWQRLTPASAPAQAHGGTP